jgi:hypothetical protein
MLLDFAYSFNVDPPDAYHLPAHNAGQLIINNVIDS